MRADRFQRLDPHRIEATARRYRRWCIRAWVRRFGWEHVLMGLALAGWVIVSLVYVR